MDKELKARVLRIVSGALLFLTSLWLGTYLVTIMAPWAAFATAMTAMTGMFGGLLLFFYGTFE